MTLQGHIYYVTLVTSFTTSDGPRLASGSVSRDGCIKVWDVMSGECVASLIPPGLKDVMVLFISASLDGCRLLSIYDDGTIVSWDTGSFECIKLLKCPVGSFRAIGLLTGDASRIVISCGRTVMIWNMLEGQCTHTLAGHKSTVRFICISPDMSRFATCSSDLKVWDSTSGECLRTLEGHNGSIMGACFSLDHKTNSSHIVSCGSDTTIKIWDVTSGTCLRTLVGHSEAVTSVCVTLCGTRVISGSEDKTIRVWDYTRGDCLRTLQGHRDYVNSVYLSYSDDGSVAYVISTSTDQSIRIWDVETGQCLQVIDSNLDRSVPLCLCPYQGVNSIAFAVSDKSIKIWDILRQQTESQQVIDRRSITKICMSKDCRYLVSASANNTTLHVHDSDSRICALCVSDDGRRMATDSDTVRNVAMSSDGHCIVFGYGKAIVWEENASQQTSTRTFIDHDDNSITALFVTADGRQATTVAYDGSIKIWDVASEICLRTFVGHDVNTTGVCMSLDGSRVVAVSSRIIEIWDVASESRVDSIELPHLWSSWTSIIAEAFINNADMLRSFSCSFENAMETACLSN
eukprot:gene25155-30379_t